MAPPHAGAAAALGVAGRVDLVGVDDGRIIGGIVDGEAIGAAGGAFVGRGIDTRGERATGTILGAALGALLGREIDRGDLRCR